MLNIIIGFAAAFLTNFLIILAVRKYKIFVKRVDPKGASDRAKYKSRLPSWISLYDLTNLLIFSFTFGYLLYNLVLLLYHYAHQNVGWGYTSDKAIFFLAMPVFIIAMCLGMIISNILSWLIPPIRKVNERAMEGLPEASFLNLTKGLVYFLAWALPFCLAFLLVGIIDPWLK